MKYQSQTPFDSIESAQEYFLLLTDTVREARETVEADTAAAAADSQLARRLDALQLASYKLARLEQHVKASHRLLNDLRTLRRLLLQERATPVAAAKSAAEP